jgi:hypothetical protein
VSMHTDWRVRSLEAGRPQRSRRARRHPPLGRGRRRRPRGPRLLLRQRRPPVRRRARAGPRRSGPRRPRRGRPAAGRDPGAARRGARPARHRPRPDPPRRAGADRHRGPPHPPRPWLCRSTHLELDRDGRSEHITDGHELAFGRADAIAQATVLEAVRRSADLATQVDLPLTGPGRESCPCPVRTQSPEVVVTCGPPPCGPVGAAAATRCRPRRSSRPRGRRGRWGPRHMVAMVAGS